MPVFLLPFPSIDPNLVTFGDFAIRWYALAYIAGLIGGFYYVRFLLKEKRFWGPEGPPLFPSLDILLLYATLGTILGGRLGNVIFYNWEEYVQNPLEILALWKGGMAFHGGLLGVICGIVLFAHQGKVPILRVADVCAAAAPLGIGFGRLANFIRPELWGRRTEVSWAMIFPGADSFPRHPSQIYEALGEGFLLFFILYWAIRHGGLRQPGFIAGLFCLGYAIARTFCEFFRDPDPLLEALPYHLTMGMVLSFPMFLLGIFLLLQARRRSSLGT